MKKHELLQALLPFSDDIDIIVVDKDNKPYSFIPEYVGAQDGYFNGGYALIRLTVPDTIGDHAAKSEREQLLEDLLVSAHAIAMRKGVDVAWERFSERLIKAGIGCITPKTFRTLESDRG